MHGVGTQLCWSHDLRTYNPGFVSLSSTDISKRWWLGVAEAGLFPGVNYYLSCWYKRSEFGIRAAIFFSAAALAGSFGGLLAAGIAQMKGVGGKPGWAWIFVSAHNRLTFNSLLLTRTNNRSWKVSQPL